MPLTEEEKKEMAAIVAASIKEAGVLDPSKKFNPGDKEIIDPLKDKMGQSPEDKIMADKTGGFRDLGEFACAVAGKGSKWYGNKHFDQLTAYSNAVMRTGGEAIFKTAGHMEEGDEQPDDCEEPPIPGRLLSPRGVQSTTADDHA